MKATSILVAAVLLAGIAATANGQTAVPGTAFYARMDSYRQYDVCRYEPRLIESLSHDNHGVVESAIRMAILVKIAQPDVASEGVAEALEELSREGATETIRLKARLATIVYAEPELFSKEAQRDYPLDDTIFRVVAERVQSVMAARID